MSDIDNNKLRRLDGGLLLVFRELLRTGRASLVASRLGLSQSAISHALSRLRDLFEDPLFVRRPHGLEPTRRALELAPRVEALIALAGEVLDRDSGFDPSRSARMFRFGAPEFVTALIGASLINRLAVVAPKITFAISHVAEEDAFRAMRTGDIEFAIGRFGARRPGFVSEPLFDDVYCVAVRKDHPFIRGSISLAQWRETGHIFAWSGSEVGEDQGNSDGVRMLAAVPHWLTVLLQTASSDGIATVPRRLALRHAEKLGLQVLDLPFAPNPIAVSTVRRTGAPDAGLGWFLEMVRAAATDEPD